MAKNPVEVDPKHYKVEFENDRVRVLRIRYGPGEKSKMHSHPAGVMVSITDTHARFTFPNGKTEEFKSKAGEVMFLDPTEHQPENLSKKPLEVIQIELKK